MYVHIITVYPETKMYWRCFTWKSKDQVWTKHRPSTNQARMLRRNERTSPVCWFDCIHLGTAESWVCCIMVCVQFCAPPERERERELQLTYLEATCCFPASSANLLRCMWQCLVTTGLEALLQIGSEHNRLDMFPVPTTNPQYITTWLPHSETYSNRPAKIRAEGDGEILICFC